MLKSERLVLRPINESDVEWLRETRNKYRDHFFDSGEITAEQQRGWYKKYRETHTDQMFIMELKDGTKIGTIAIYNIDVAKRTATFGRFLLLNEFTHKGYAEEAVKCLLDYCWNKMRLYKLNIEVYLENLDAIAIYARAGFKTGKPIIHLEKVNEKVDFNKPMIIGSYDDMSEEGYESTGSNVK